MIGKLNCANIAGISERTDVVISTRLMPLIVVLLLIFLFLLCLFCVELAIYRRSVAFNNMNDR